jgi:hypothetical protein
MPTTASDPATAAVTKTSKDLHIFAPFAIRSLTVERQIFSCFASFSPQVNLILTFRKFLHAGGEGRGGGRIKGCSSLIWYLPTQESRTLAQSFETSLSGVECTP